jgi:hypothetical protein
MPCKNQRRANRKGTLADVYTTIANNVLSVSQLDVKRENESCPYEGCVRKTLILPSVELDSERKHYESGIQNRVGL